MVLTIGVTKYVYFNIRIAYIIFHPHFSICTIRITLLSKKLWEGNWSKRKEQIRFLKWVRVLHKTTIKDFFKIINRDSHRQYFHTQILTLYKTKRWVEKTKCQKFFSFALKNITKVIQLKNAYYFSNYMYATPSICIGSFVCDWQYCLDAVLGDV